MKIRDAYAEINGDDTEVELPSGALDIIADDGKTLFTIKLESGSIEISTGGFCKHEEKLLDSPISIRPRSSNVLIVERVKWK